MQHFKERNPPSKPAYFAPIRHFKQDIFRGLEDHPQLVHRKILNRYGRVLMKSKGHLLKAVLKSLESPAVLMSEYKEVFKCFH